MSDFKEEKKTIEENLPKLKNELESKKTEIVEISNKIIEDEKIHPDGDDNASR